MPSAAFAATVRAGGIADRLRAAGRPFSVVGENLAHNFNAPDPVATAVRGWMESTGHRENLLRETCTQTGVGICTSERGYYFTQIFVRPPPRGASASH